MGFRTIVMLSNDRANDWSKDPLLGEKIAMGMNDVQERFLPNPLGGWGKVVECVHADATTLAILSHYTSFDEVGQIYERQTSQEQAILLLKEMADKLGFRVVKKSKQKEKK